MLDTIVDNVIKKVRLQQMQKGLNTYGQTLDDCPADAYDWNVMAIEELTDAINYLAKENKRLKDRNVFLEEKLTYLRKYYK